MKNDIVLVHKGKRMPKGTTIDKIKKGEKMSSNIREGVS